MDSIVQNLLINRVQYIERFCSVICVCFRNNDGFDEFLACWCSYNVLYRPMRDDSQHNYFNIINVASACLVNLIIPSYLTALIAFLLIFSMGNAWLFHWIHKHSHGLYVAYSSYFQKFLTVITENWRIQSSSISLTVNRFSVPEYKGHY